MLKLIEKIESPVAVSGLATLTLAYERRIISRQRVTLDDGSDAGLFLPRGTILYAGDILRAETGELVFIQAALEQLSTVHCDDLLLFARVCYHLGNRHVPVQITNGVIRYQHDHVLDEMVHTLGLHVQVELACFQPEAGAYAGQTHSPAAHSHSHTHSHEH